MVAKNPSKRFFVNYNLQDGKEIASKKYKKFIGLLTKNGNRVKAENILKSAFLKLYQRTGMSYF
jgi:ribosomal protein S7